MKLTLQIKLIPSKTQQQFLLDTFKECNAACNDISKIAWSQKVFNQFKLHHLVYYSIKNSTRLSAQMVIRCISKVVDSYKTDKEKKHAFNLLGAITYDPRILSYKDMVVSISTINGRIKIPFICHNEKYIPYIKGEADLVTRNGKFYLFQTVEVPENEVIDVEEFIGVDFGITDIAALSNGTSFSSQALNTVRDKNFKTRRSVQSKGTQGSKKLLKRLKGRERRFATITNHTIAKSIVQSAVSEGKGIAIEDLTYIRKRTTVRKTQRRRYGSWAFSQLRHFLEYKAKLAGIPFAVVNPQYTSKTCNICKHIGNRKGKRFNCTSCGNIDDADINAAKNISQLGAIVNCPEKAKNMSCSVSHISLKAITL